MNVKCIKSNQNGTFVFILINIMLLSVRLVSELKETFKLHLNLRFDDIDSGDVRCLTLNACDSGHLMSSLLNTQQYIFVAVTTPWNTLQHIDCVIPLLFRCVHSFRHNVDPNPTRPSTWPMHFVHAPFILALVESPLKRDAGLIFALGPFLKGVISQIVRDAL